MSDVTELRAALNLSEGDSMHGDSLLLHAAQRIRELEAALSQMKEEKSVKGFIPAIKKPPR